MGILDKYKDFGIGQGVETESSAERGLLTRAGFIATLDESIADWIVDLRYRRTRRRGKSGRPGPGQAVFLFYGRRRRD